MLGMIRKRSRFDAMAPVAEVTWLVVADQYGDSLYVRELPQNQSLRNLSERREVTRFRIRVSRFAFCTAFAQRNAVQIVNRDTRAAIHGS
jgi:hypothetical protein